MEPTIPFALKATTRAVELFVLAAQIHFSLLLYRYLRSKEVSLAKPLSVAVGVMGVALLASSEMVTLHLEVYELFRRLPQAWHFASAVHLAGSFGAYSVYWGWRILSRQEEEKNGGAGWSRRELINRTAQAAAVAPFLAGGYGVFIVRDNFEIRESELKYASLPADLDGLRLIQISDIHFGPYLTRKDLERVVGMANEMRPHLALLTGDFITREGDPLEECFGTLAGLNTDSGVWGCLGNHEEFAHCSAEATRIGARRGIEILRDEKHGLKFGQASFTLAGVDYQRRDEEYLIAGKSLLDPESFNLLLSHSPDVFPKAAELGFDLTLSGHTHGGQVTVEIVEQQLNPGRFFTPFVVGEYRIGDKLEYVTRGIGTVNLPMRIGARPEIAALTLRRG